mgnify:CR=1 FL=1
MHQEIIKAYVDTKEQAMRKKSLAFFKQNGIDAEERTLEDFGDIACLLKCEQYLNIERKSFGDFVTSYISNHLQDQAVRMNKVCTNYCVIVHGNINDLRWISKKYPAVKHIKQPSIDKMVRTMEMVYKCPIFFVDNEVQYFQEILRIAESINKHQGTKLKSKQASTLKNRKDVDFLMIANKIGEKTALTLLKEFKTPEKVFTASRDELKQINGIGDATIADIKEAAQVFYEGL